MASVHWAFAKMNSSRAPVINIDVNLRNELEKDYQGIALLIGMCSVGHVAQRFNFKKGNVSFWQFAKALKAEMTDCIKMGNHCAYHKVTEILDRQGCQDNFDMNFSSMGKYTFVKGFIKSIVV